MEVADAAAGGAGAYSLIDERMPDGLAPVLVLPHLNGSGTPLCDLQSKGAIVGLTMATTRHDIAKAILEGLCFELRTNVQTLTKLRNRNQRVGGRGRRREVGALAAA